MTNEYFLDTEFFEDGKTIELISMAFVDGNGCELYMVNAEFNLHRYAGEDETAVWLRKNVVPHLPVKVGNLDPWVWDVEHPDYETHVFSRAAMRAQILTFMRARSGVPVLWANYSAYDFVALRQLWGNMRAQDPMIPWYCNDLQQTLRDHVINSLSLPRQDPSTEHHALGDAKHLRECVTFARDVIRHRQRMVRE